MCIVLGLRKHSHPLKWFFAQFPGVPSSTCAAQHTAHPWGGPSVDLRSSPLCGSLFSVTLVNCNYLAFSGSQVCLLNAGSFLDWSPCTLAGKLIQGSQLGRLYAHLICCPFVRITVLRGLMASVSQTTVSCIMFIFWLFLVRKWIRSLLLHLGYKLKSHNLFLNVFYLGCLDGSVC